jgi:hypothetical protein
MKEGPRKSSSQLCNEGPEVADHLENKIVCFPLGRDVTTRKSAWLGFKLTWGADSVPVGCSKRPVQRRFLSFPTSLPISMALVVLPGQTRDKLSLSLLVSQRVPTSSAVLTGRRFDTRRPASIFCWRDRRRATVQVQPTDQEPVPWHGLYEQSRSCRENPVEVAVAA